MVSFFFFNDTAATEIYTLSLHDALPILVSAQPRDERVVIATVSSHAIRPCDERVALGRTHKASSATPSVASAIPAHCTLDKDRKSTRLNSSHANISYAVFCLKKKIYLLL